MRRQLAILGTHLRCRQNSVTLCGDENLPSMTTPSTNDTISVGLIGFGLAGRAFHAPVISAVPGLRLAAILQRTGSEAAEAYPNARIARTLDELLALPRSARRYRHAQRDALPFRASMPRRRPRRARRQALHHHHGRSSRSHPVRKRCGRLLTVYQSRRYDGDFQGILQLAAARHARPHRPVRNALRSLPPQSQA